MTPCPEHVFRYNQTSQLKIINLSDFAQAFPVVVSNNISICILIDSFLTEGISARATKVTCFFYLKSSSIFSNFVLIVHVVMPYDLPQSS